MSRRARDVEFASDEGVLSSSVYIEFGLPPDVTELGHCVTQARRLPCRPTEASRRMTGVLRELPRSYAVLSKGRRCGSASAVHEPSLAGPLTAPHRSRPPDAPLLLRRPARVRVFHRAGTAASQAGPEGDEAASRAVRWPPHLRALSLGCAPEEALQNRGNP